MGVRRDRSASGARHPGLRRQPGPHDDPRRQFPDACAITAVVGSRRSRDGLVTLLLEPWGHSVASGSVRRGLEECGEARALTGEWARAGTGGRLNGRDLHAGHDSERSRDTLMDSDGVSPWRVLRGPLL
jgi:hypothetical protein